METHQFLLKVALVLCPTLAWAGTTGSLEGRVTDRRTGEPLAHVSVLLLQSRQGAVTDARGFYKIHNIRAGSHDVEVSMIGYGRATSRDIIILPDRRSELNVQLVESPIEMRAVEVTIERPLIQTDVTGTAYEIDTDVLISLPVSTVREVIGLQPGTTREGHVRGGKTREVIYLVDGLPVQDVIQGGPGAELPLSAISQMSVKTGGFDAEYGNALSGVINVITRTAGDDHELSLRVAKDDLFGGREVSRRNEIELFAGGPLRGAGLSYLTANSLALSDTRWWQDMQHFFDGPIRRELNGLTKLDYALSPDTRLSSEVIYSLQRWRDYEFSWRYNLDGLPSRLRDSHRAALLWTQTLSSTVFYTASLSRFSLDSKIGQGRPADMDLTPYDYDFHLLYITSGARAWRVDSQQRIYTAKADITGQILTTHLLKAGAELKQYDIDADIVRMEPQTTYFGRPRVHEPLLNYSTRYHYYPRAGSAYVQDKVEGKDGSLFSFGLRLDFLDPRARRPAVELIPTGPEAYEEEVRGCVAASAKYHVSPRLGCSFPLTDRSFFFANYGSYVQYPLFDHLYSGLDNVSLRGGVNALRGNPDLLAERTRAWEVSVRHDLSWGVVASLAYFNKETRDQIDTKTFVPTNSRIAGDYGFAEYVNNAYATASGHELVISRSAGKWIRGNLSYVRMRTEGLSEYEDQGLNYAQWGFALANSPYRLSWDQRHTLKADIGIDLPLAISADLAWEHHSGRPYTYYPSTDGFTPDTPGQPFLPNNRRMSENNLISLKISREVRVGSSARVDLYVDSRNILDAHNVRWVDASGRVGGELSDPSAYHTPRRTLVGARVEL